jgi:hypothetical protein
MIIGEHVCLDGDVAGLLRRTEAAALKGRMTTHLGYQALAYPASPFGNLENGALIALLRKLNALGVLFGEDYKQGWSPADVMRELQERKLVAEPFTSIAWRGPGEWFTTTHPPARPG